MANTPTLIPTAQAKMQGEVDAMRRALGSLVDAAAEIAAFRKRMYDEHVKAGFTAEQALALCHKL